MKDMDYITIKRKLILLSFFIVLSIYGAIKHFHKNTLAFVFSVVAAFCFLCLFIFRFYKYRIQDSPTQK